MNVNNILALPIIVIVFLLSPAIGFPQLQMTSSSSSALNIGGGSNAITKDFVLDWSIGESTIIESFIGRRAFSNSIENLVWHLTSGVLQPFDITHIIYNNRIPGWTSEEVRLFPVPASNTVNVDFRSITDGSVTDGRILIQFFDQYGKILGTREMPNSIGRNTQTWDVSNLPSSSYYFNIMLRSKQGEIVKQGIYIIKKIK